MPQSSILTIADDRPSRSPAWVPPLDVLVSIVVPVYNEAGNIQPLLDRIMRAVAGLPHRFEVVLVDDGSQDQTWQAIAHEAVRGRGVLTHVTPLVEDQNPGCVAVGGFVVGFEADRRRA